MSLNKNKFLLIGGCCYTLFPHREIVSSIGSNKWFTGKLEIQRYTTMWIAHYCSKNIWQQTWLTEVTRNEYLWHHSFPQCLQIIVTYKKMSTEVIVSLKMVSLINKRPMGLDALVIWWPVIKVMLLSIFGAYRKQLPQNYLWLKAKWLHCNLLQENWNLIHKG